jgi:hypothetical protein
MAWEHSVCSRVLLSLDLRPSYFAVTSNLDCEDYVLNQVMDELFSL